MKGDMFQNLKLPSFSFKLPQRLKKTPPGAQDLPLQPSEGEADVADKKAVVPAATYKKGNLHLGLDIGSKNLVLTERYITATEDLLVHAHVASWTGEREKLDQAIGEVLKNAHAESWNVNLSVGGDSVVVRLADVPKMKPDDFRKSLAFEADRYIPFPAQDVYMDFMILPSPGSPEAPGSSTMHVALVAAKRDEVDFIIKASERCGLHVNTMDIDSFAILNAFCAAYPQEAEKAFILLHMGHAKTSLLLASKRLPVFCREFSWGGQGIEEVFSKRLAIEPAVARETLLGFRRDNEQLRGLVESYSEKLIGEIRSSVSYFENQAMEADRLSKVYVSGGLSKLEGLDELLASQLGLEVGYWNAIGGLGTGPDLRKEDLEEWLPQLAVSVGLSSR